MTALAITDHEQLNTYAPTISRDRWRDNVGPAITTSVIAAQSLMFVPYLTDHAEFSHQISESWAPHWAHHTQAPSVVSQSQGYSAGSIREHRQAALQARVTALHETTSYDMESAADAAQELIDSEPFIAGWNGPGSDPVTFDAVREAITFLKGIANTDLDIEAFPEMDGGVTVSCESDKGDLSILFLGDGRRSVYGRSQNAGELRVGIEANQDTPGEVYSFLAAL